MDVEEKEHYDERARVVLFNLCHGALLVEYSITGKTENFDFSSTIAPTNIDKLLKAPTAICSISSKFKRREQIQILHKVCLPYMIFNKKFVDDEFMERCKEELILSSDDLKSQLIPSASTQTRSQPTQSFSDNFKDISKCTNTFEYVKSKRGEKIKNKVWAPDNLSGITIMFDVIFELPYTPTGLPFDKLNTGNINFAEDLRTHNNVYPQRMFLQRIGRVSIVDGKHCISYTEGTNLLTCPYFIEYTLRSIPGATEENMHLYVFTRETFQDRFGLIMTNKIDANILYSYFQHVNKIHHIDMSCDALEFVDPTGKTPKNEIEMRFSVQTNAKRHRILKGFNTTDCSFSARGSKGRRKTRQTKKQPKSKQKKSRKSRK
jgi:hypothetical protein